MKTMKKLTAILLTLAMLLSLTATAITADEPAQPDDSRPVEIEDVVHILMHLAKMHELPVTPYDFNNNGMLDIGDVLIGLMGLANMIEKPMIVMEDEICAECGKERCLCLEPLSEELVLRIKSDFLTDLFGYRIDSPDGYTIENVSVAPYLIERFGHRPDFPEGYSVNRVSISPYLGTYNGSVVMKIRRLYSGSVPMVWHEDVAGYRFRYGDSSRIVVWNDGEFFGLSDVAYFGSIIGAYNIGLLTEQDVGDIWYHWNAQQEQSVI